MMMKAIIAFGVKDVTILYFRHSINQFDVDEEERALNKKMKMMIIEEARAEQFDAYILKSASCYSWLSIF
jgi:hypothetical protein